jgi:hypothetical protein
MGLFLVLVHEKDKTAERPLQHEDRNMRESDGHGEATVIASSPYPRNVILWERYCPVGALSNVIRMEAETLKRRRKL